MGTESLAIMPADRDNHAAENTVSEAGATETPSGNTELADVLSAALAPFLGQMTQLNENVSLLLSGQDESEEEGETASV